MTTRVFAAAAALACALAGLLAPAGAGQPGYGGFDDGYYGGYGRPPYPDPYDRPYPQPLPQWWGEQPEEIIVWITCGQGKELLFQRGYYNVKTDNCRGPNYRYTAWRGGERFDIRMSASGEINRVRLAP